MKLQSIKSLTVLTPQERALIQCLKPLGKQPWSTKNRTIIAGVDVTDEIKSLKRKIVNSQLAILNNTCTYCGSKLGIQSDGELDHFINKKRKPEFTFELQNLFVSCHKCNFPARKGQRKTYWRDHRKYAKCRFKIVHPHFDSVDKHFEYRIMNNNQIQFIVTINPLTRKARKTISFFGLNEPKMVENRAAQYMQQTFTNPTIHLHIFNEVLLNEFYTI
jgi:uncharacterized protein (TIGR02646 family)